MTQHTMTTPDTMTHTYTITGMTCTGCAVVKPVVIIVEDAVMILMSGMLLIGLL